jgi:hypothetical protein
MKNFRQAIKEQKRVDEVKLVSIGTIAETGDRMPPIHWGRVGDPIKPVYMIIMQYLKLLLNAF